MQKILIIDDEEVLLEAIGGYFKHKGFDTFSASSGGEGLEIVKKESPDLLILDLHLGGDLSGVGALREAKKIKSDLKVIILTGFGEEDESKDMCMDLGVSKFLAKPMSLKELGKNVEGVLNE